MPEQQPAPDLRLLVVEGNDAPTRALHVRAGGVIASEGYAALLRQLGPGAHVDIVYPADADATLPPGIGLGDYHGVALTGSSLHVQEGGPAVTRQIDLARALLAARVPVFGSCWGLQVLAVAAGGAVRRNPKGRELGIGRNIRLTRDGRTHAMYRDKPGAFSATTVHRDEVETLPPGARLLATNGFSTVQALDFGRGAVPVWGVQYHPEYPLSEIAAIIRRIPSLVAEGFFESESGRMAYAGELDLLGREPGRTSLAWRLGIDGDVLDEQGRTREIANWVEIVRALAARG